ncbi:MAG: VOC family protein [Duodenibacillus sp.]|nr:VOC family protein [Duodenibacillus sp.]
MENTPKVRLSRPTNNLERDIHFYRDGLGFDILDRFVEQHGLDGVIFGHRGWPYQIEVVSRRDEAEVPRAPSADMAMIFSIPEAENWEARLKALFDAGFSPVPLPSLYDDGASVCYEDPDGYRVILRRGKWKK